MGLFSRALVVAALVVAGTAATGPAAVQAGPQRQVSIDALAARLTHWVADSDVRAHDKAVQRVRAGVPPVALAAFLAAARVHPDPRYTSLLSEATRYRKVSVRGQALAALACVDPGEAERAIALAAGDHDRTIRRLAWALERLHPSPAAHEVIAALLERDPDLAEELAATYGPTGSADAADDADLDAEIVIFDDVGPEQP